MALASTSLFSAHAQILAFPGAQGFGRFASGGRGGTVYHVTTLADSGAGSFRDAVSQPNRIVVFEVGGYITLNSEVSVKRNITIAGQTAPGGSIALRGAEVSFGSSSNVICRHVRFRPGSGAVSTANGLNFNNATNMIFDQVSVAFAPWNNIDGVGCRDITFQRLLNADPIGQQFGAHMEQLGANCAWYQNIFANGHNRQPLSKINTIYLNNVVYNYEAAYTCGNTSGDFSHDLINNYFITGPATDTPGNDFYQIGPNQSIYESGNLRDSNADGVLNGSATHVGEGTPLGSPWSALTPAIPTVSAATAFRRNLSLVGAWPRDQVDNLILNEIRSLGTAGPNPLPGSQTVTGLGNNGFGTINGGATPLDTDQDGLPDYWEVATGSNPNSNDAMVIGADGYAKIENYLNWLAEPHAVTPTNGAVAVDLWGYTTGFTNAAPVYFLDSATNGAVTLTNGHVARFTPDAGFSGLGRFRFAVVSSDGLDFTNIVVVLVSALPPPANLHWRGDGLTNLWTTGSGLNWFDGAGLVTFASGDNVTFDDGGSNSPAINLSGAISAGTVQVLADQDYTFGGSGALTGPTALFKAGAGQLTLNNLNTFSGGTTINEGTVQLGDGLSLNGNLSGNVTNRATLIFANPAALTSSASLSGPGTLTKTGSGTLTLSANQSLTNVTKILAGALEFSGTPPSGPITNNGVLTFKSAFPVACSGVISGPGSVVVNNSSATVYLTGANAYTGGTTNTAGNLVLAHNRAAGTGPVIYTAGSVLVGGGAVITNDFSIPGNATTDLSMQATNGTGVWAGNIVNLGSGASWRPGADTGGTLVFTGTAALGGRNFIVPRGSVQFASNAVISATGSATAFGRDTSGGNRSANITLKDNAAITLGVCSLGGNQAGGSVTLTLQNNAALSTGANLFNLHHVARSTAVTALRLNGGTLTTGGFSKTNLTYTNNINFNGGVLKANASGTFLLPSFLPAFTKQTANVQSGGVKIDDSGLLVTISQPLIQDPALGATPDGGLTKRGAGGVVLRGQNTFTGPTTILAGDLLLASPGTIANSRSIYIAAGAQFDTSAAGTFLLANGRALWGNGSVNGAFSLGNRGMLAPGTNGIGRISFISDTVFVAGSTNLIELDKSSLTNDSVKVFGNLSLGGTLLVTNLAGALAAGDSFRLFDAASYSGAFATVVLPALDDGLAWNTNQLSTAGSISVMSLAPPVIGSVSLAGNSLTLGGTGGNAGATYYVLTSTNVALARTNWRRELTNTFGPGGVFSVTNTIEAAVPGKFYSLELP